MTRNKYISHDGFHLILIIYKYLFVPPLFQDKLIPPNNNIVSKLNNNKFYFLYFTVIVIVKKSTPLSFPLQISFRIVFALKSHTHQLNPTQISIQIIPKSIFPIYSFMAELLKQSNSHRPLVSIWLKPIIVVIIKILGLLIFILSYRFF